MSSATRWGLTGLILLSLSLSLYLGRQIFIPTVIAVLLACMLWPAVQWLNQSLRVPWSLACASAVAVLVVLLLGTTLAFSLVVPRLLQSLPNDPDKAQQSYARFRMRLERLSPWPLDPHYFPEKAEESAALKYLQSALDPKNPQFVVNTLVSVGAVTGVWMWQSTLITFLLFFLLLEGRMLTQRLVELVGSGAQTRAQAIVALQEIASSVRAFLVWRTLINFAMAIILGLVYYIVGLSHAWIWALMTAVLLYVPYLGPILAGIPPVLDAFVSVESPWVAVGILMFYLAFVTMEGYFIVPLVMGRSMDLNATTVMLACLYWELVWGPAGLFLAMPVMAAAKAVR